MGFVPTMGALHRGHASLLDQCRTECETVVLSIYVNPLQFGPKEDFSKYPRPIQADLEVAERAGTDVVFAPDGADLTGGMLTKVTVSGVSELFEGAMRPGHFDGVATIVCKLLNIVRPDVAYFGLKDLQQCAVVRQAVADLGIATRLELCETVREESGLALSSRNEYLDKRQRKDAALLYRTLCLVAEQLRAGNEKEPSFRDALATLTEAGFDTEYLDLVDPRTMKPVSVASPGSRLVIASRYCNVRLIDNILVTPLGPNPAF